MPNIIFKCFDLYSLVPGVERPIFNNFPFFLYSGELKICINGIKNLSISRTRDLNLNKK